MAGAEKDKKTFVVINGKELYIIFKDDIRHAITWAQNVCDNSKEIIVREVNNIEQFNTKTK